MRTVWQPTARDMLYARTGEATWDCTACCLDGHPARAHGGTLAYGWDEDLRVKIFTADPCLLLTADAIEGIARAWPPFGRFGEDLLRLEAANRTVIYRLTRQPQSDRPSGATPAVAEVFPPYGEFYLAEWPD